MLAADAAGVLGVVAGVAVAAAAAASLSASASTSPARPLTFPETDAKTR